VPLDREISMAVSLRLSRALDRWADHLGAHLDMNPLFSAVRVGEHDPASCDKPD
jgi:hypothetical protein